MKRASEAGRSVGTDLQLGPERAIRKNNESREQNEDKVCKAEPSVSDVGTKLQLRPTDGPVRWRKPRLDRSAYTGQRTYHIALVTAQRIPFFEFSTDARPYEAALRDAALKLQFDLLAYCFMPDHLHVLLKGQQHSSDLLRFVQRFKQLTGFQFKRESGERLWQQSSYDRILRKGENSRAVAQYIFDNPSTASLPAASAAYELRGGIYYEGPARTELKLRPYILAPEMRLKHD